MDGAILSIAGTLLLNQHVDKIRALVYYCPRLCKYFLQKQRRAQLNCVRTTRLFFVTNVCVLLPQGHRNGHRPPYDPGLYSSAFCTGQDYITLSAALNNAISRTSAQSDGGGHNHT